MSIRRAARKQANFTLIDNVVFNSGLSYRAIGLLTYLLSKPDHWQVSVTQLIRNVADSAKPDGRDAIYATLSELIDKHFVERTQKRNERGQANGYDYIVYDEPLSDIKDKPYTDKPYTAEPTQVSTEVLASTENEVSTDNPLTSNCVQRVFAHWKAVMGKTKRTLLDDKRKRRIEWAVKHYGADEACKAIDGCACSPFHMGDNDKKQRYNDLTLIFRDAEKVERFIVLADAPPITTKPRSKFNGLDDYTGEGLREINGRKTL